MSAKTTTTVGLYGIGLETYWPQFEGLRERLVGYQGVVADKLRSLGANVVDVGLIDNPEKTRAAADRFQREDVDLIFLYVSTYALSSTVLPVVQKLGKPVVVLNLQPTRAIDYATFNKLGDRTKMTGEWLANCQACSVPEIANAFLRSGVEFYQITGVLQDDPFVDDKLRAWIEAARVASILKSSRIGLLGHYYNGMLDIYSDLTRLSAQLGPHFEIREFGEVLERREQVSEPEIDARVAEIWNEFDVRPDCVDFELRRAARTSVALDKFVSDFDLDALAYFYNGHGDERYEDLIASVIVGNSMLTARGVPVAGEYEVKNVLAMKILDSFGVGGAFSEFYALDFDDDVVLLGHDGPCHRKLRTEKRKSNRSKFITEKSAPVSASKRRCKRARRRCFRSSTRRTETSNSLSRKGFRRKARFSKSETRTAVIVSRPAPASSSTLGRAAARPTTAPSASVISPTDSKFWRASSKSTLSAFANVYYFRAAFRFSRSGAPVFPLFLRSF